MTIILTPNLDTFTNPTMVALFETLQQDGEQVRLFCPRQVVPCPENIKNVEIIESVYRLNVFTNPKFLFKQLRTYLRVKNTIRKYNVKTVMVVDPLGMIAGGRLKRFLCRDIKISYLSFEIFFKNELQGHYLKLKEKEIYYSKYIDSLLIQDPVRKELLFIENNLHLPDDKVALVPVSPIDSVINDVVDVRSKFCIPEDKKLVVYSGSVGKWCGTDAIIEMFDKGYWPQTHHLVFHTRRPLTYSDKYYADLTRLDNDPNIPFTLHSNPFDSFAELGAFLKGFDVALALYYPNNENPYYGMNMKEIGLSSGKFSMYMMLGLPTIVTPCRTYNSLAENYNFGAILSNNEDIAPLLDADFSRAEARRLYVEALCPDARKYLKIIFA